MAQDVKIGLSIDGAKQVEQAFQNLGRAAQDSARQINNSFSKVSFSSSINKSILDVQRSFGTLRTSFTDVANNFRNVEQAAIAFIGKLGLLGTAATGAAAAIGLLTNRSIQQASELVDNANAAGISVEKYTELEFVLGQMGVTSEKFRTLMSKLPSVIKEVNENFDKYNDKLKENTGAANKNGQSQKEISEGSLLLAKKLRDLGVTSKDSTTFLNQLFDGLKKLGSEQERVSILSDLFGAKIGPRLAEAAGVGSAALDKLAQKLRDRGFFPSEQELKNLENAGDSIQSFGRGIDFLRQKIAAQATPTITNIFDSLVRSLIRNQGEVLSWTDDVIQRLSKWVLAVRDVLGGEAFIETPQTEKIKEFLKSFDQFVQGLQFTGRILKATILGITESLNSFFGANLTPEFLLGIVLLGKFTGAFTLLWSILRLGYSIFGTLLLSILRTIGAIGSLRIAFGLLVALFSGAALGLAVAALAYYVIQNWEQIKKATIELWQTIKARLPEIWEGIKEVVRTGFEALKEIATSAGNGIIEAAKFIWDGIKNSLSNAREGIIQVAKDLWYGITTAGTDSIEGAKTVVTSITNGIINVLGLAFTPIEVAAKRAWGAFTSAASWIGEQLKPIWESIKSTASSILGQISQAIASPWQTAATTIADRAKDIQNAINQIISLSGSPEQLQGIITNLTNPFLQARDQIIQILNQIGLQIPIIFQTILSTLAAYFSQLSIYFSPIIQQFNSIFQQLFLNLRNIIFNSGIAEAFNILGNQIIFAIQNAAIQVESIARAMANSVIASANAAISALQSIRSAGGGGFASGGYVAGPGSGTSDSIPAWLSNGEFVVRAAAVRKYGLGLLYKINNLDLSGSLKNGMNGFAMGGLVGVPSPSLAIATTGGRPINLTIGSDVFSLNATEDVANRLIKYAHKRSVSSSGRKPSWYGA